MGSKNLEKKTQETECDLIESQSQKSQGYALLQRIKKIYSTFHESGFKHWIENLP